MLADGKVAGMDGQTVRTIENESSGRQESSTVFINSDNAKEIQAGQYTAQKAGYLDERHRYFHLKDTASQERDFHFHEFDKIVILLSGRVDYAVENEIYTLHPWEILLVRHHVIHKAVIDKSVPYERIIIYLNEDYYSSILPEADLTHCFAYADSTLRRLLIPVRNRMDEIQDVILRYEKQLFVSNVQTEAMRETLIMQLLILLDAVASDGATGSPHRYGDKTERALSYIDSHLASALTVDEIASVVYLSKYHFMRMFRETTGTTVHAYVRQRRLLNAAQLIREGVSATVAARNSGFEDYTVFYRAFRKSFGVTPAEFKK